MSFPVGKTNSEKCLVRGSCILMLIVRCSKELNIQCDCVLNSLGKLHLVFNPSGIASAAAIVIPVNGLWKAAGTHA